MNRLSNTRVITPLTWVMRILVGVTFTFSGFVKAIDPWGTLYKFKDYVNVLGPDLNDYLLILGVFALCTYEFCTGVFLLTGSFRRSSPYAAALLMLFMLPLTLWIAISNPVADCGCFGDALIISNWATFWKNVVLSAAIVWLCIFNTRCRCLINPYFQWIGILASAGYIIIIGLIGYLYQPLLDFRPYPIGSSLLASHNDSASTNSKGKKNDEENVTSGSISESSEEESYKEKEEDNLIFVYIKDGVEKSFRITDELPDESEGWVFVRREKPENPDNTESKNTKEDSSAVTFRIWSDNGEEDVTEQVVRNYGRQLFLLMPELKNVSLAQTWRINSLYHWSKDNDIDMIGIVAGSPAEIEEWIDISLASYPIYTAEDTELQMLARGNPAVVYLENGKIIWKSSLKAIDAEDFQSSEALKEPRSYGRDNKAILRNISCIYLIIMVILIFFTFVGKYLKIRTDLSKSSVNHDDREDH